jgi:NADH:ubiquinone oxidoreductase subunit K
MFNFIYIGIFLSFVGGLGLLLNKKNLLMSVIAIELMFYGLNFNWVSSSLLLDEIFGEIFALFILTLAAAESALALGLITAYFRVYGNILL